jgi:(p)ppGpp synthase/HD superfamily hydrolase
VNGKLVPLRYTLRQGDIVEVVTSPNQHPSRDWLKIVKSTRARSKINQWLKIEERARSIELGREMFDRETKKYRLNGAALLAGDEIKRVGSDLGYPGVDDLLAALHWRAPRRSPWHPAGHTTRSSREATDRSGGSATRPARCLGEPAARRPSSSSRATSPPSSRPRS